MSLQKAQPKNCSLANWIASLPAQKNKLLNSLSEQEALRLLYDWGFWARKKQKEPPGDWFCWLIRSGRGFGKTRTGAEWIRKRVRQGYKRIALIGQTKADVRDTMVELEESSLLKIHPPWNKPTYQPSKRRVVWENGAVATLFSGDEPDQLRGPQHDSAWVDELAKFKYPEETWYNLEMGLRIGNKPQVVVTTTPRPIPIIKELINDQRTVDIKGHTKENANNLSPLFIDRMLNKYEGTRLGRQELGGNILADNPQALWSRDLLDELKINRAKLPDLKRIVVAIDPAATSNKKSNEVGIVVAGIDEFERGYVLEDLSLSAKPNKWAKIAVNAYNDFAADTIVAESNQGGEMIESVIKTVDLKVPVKLIHATRGKYTRAEPVSSLYEQRKVYHVGNFPKLEDQMCSWIPGEGSPDRLDALVWALTELILDIKVLRNVTPSGLKSSSKWR